jgi:hypothetical protein
MVSVEPFETGGLGCGGSRHSGATLGFAGGIPMADKSPRKQERPKKLTTKEKKAKKNAKLAQKHETATSKLGKK